MLGRISFPNSGAAAAQAPFIRGVLLLHSFEYDDAIAAFREAQQLDRGFALAYWGEALCYNQPLWGNENVEKARAALARLAPTTEARLAKAPTEREKGYLRAVERLFAGGSRAERAHAYADRMAELSRQNPSDDEAAAFYALALLGTVADRERSTQVSLQAGAIASAILERNPQHPGAAHYVLHAYDDGEHAAMALKAARIYSKIAPASSHARHMASHAFLPLGLWDEAAASDESAFQVSVERARRLGLSPAQYDFHALGWLQYEYLQQGRFSKAREAMAQIDRALATTPALPARPAPPAPPAPVESEIGRGYSPVSLKSERASMRARLVVDSGDWAIMKGQVGFENVDELYALALASINLGDRGRVTAAVDELQRAVSNAPSADNRQLAEIMLRAARGLHAIASGNRTEGLAALSSAATLEQQAPKPIARPYPIKPVLELYGEVLLETGDAAGAVRAFQRSLERTPRRATSMIGLARAAAAAKQPQLAARTAREFLTMWHLADREREEIKDAEALARLR